MLSGCVNFSMMLNCPIKFSNKAINKEIHKCQLVTDAQNCAPTAELQAPNKTHPQTLLTEKLSVWPFWPLSVQGSLYIIILFITHNVVCLSTKSILADTWRQPHMLCKQNVLICIASYIFAINYLRCVFFSWQYFYGGGTVAKVWKEIWLKPAFFLMSSRGRLLCLQKQDKLDRYWKTAHSSMTSVNTFRWLYWLSH